MSFEGKAVLITGASSGIGAAIAIAFAKEAADVAIVGRNHAKLAAVQEKCTNYKPPLVINADVTKDEDAKRIVQATIDKFGNLDVLVNNAGISYMGCIADGKLMETYDAVIATNLRAAMHIAFLSTPHLIKTKGNIVNVSSVGGSCPPLVPAMLPYGVSKAALNHFTIGCALELSAHGVRVNAVSPGPVKTDLLENCKFANGWEVFGEMTALKRVSDPEEIANVILFLASDKASSVTGANYFCDNGMSLVR